MTVDRGGRFGPFGGAFIPETLVFAVQELSEAFFAAQADPAFCATLDKLLREYAGRPTPLTFAENLSCKCGCRLYLKREDLLHTGAHKINNALGQALLAKRLGKRRLVAETGAGQHGVAVATAGAKLGLEAVIYMGAKDVERQRLNVFRMELLGAQVRVVHAGSQTLKDAINEALRDWTANVEGTHYLLGSVLGPHPYPEMVAWFQTVIGREARAQMLETEGRLPDAVVACVGGGSNAIGMFRPFLQDQGVQLIGVEAAGQGIETGRHAARFADPKSGRPGVLHGAFTYVLQDSDGQVLGTHSIAAGLDYPAVGPEHAYLRAQGRVRFTTADDDEALAALRLLSKREGILPALESAHAVAYALRLAQEAPADGVILINLSGRGDKDLLQLAGKAGASS
ncbi:MAG TPA: tryptophan synthase subunit beta [Candidatus Bipolaricaulota bacterium]